MSMPTVGHCACSDLSLQVHFLDFCTNWLVINKNLTARELQRFIAGVQELEHKLRKLCCAVLNSGKIFVKI